MKGTMTNNNTDTVKSSKSTTDLSTDASDKDYDIMVNKIRTLLDKTESTMENLINEYNEKYEDNEDVYQIETTDLSNLFVQLSDFCEDHQ